MPYLFPRTSVTPLCADRCPWDWEGDPGICCHGASHYSCAFFEYTFLIRACCYSQVATQPCPPVVSCLLSHKADVAVRMFCGLTALFWADLRGDTAICAVLGDELTLSPLETSGLIAIRNSRQRSKEADELLTFGVCSLNAICLCIFFLLVQASQPAELYAPPKQKKIVSKLPFFANLLSYAIFYVTSCPFFPVIYGFFIAAIR